MKAKDVRTIEDFEKYLKQCGADCKTMYTAEGIYRYRIQDKNRLDRAIDINFDAVNHCHSGHMFWLQASRVPGCLQFKHFYDLEMICKIIWKFSRKRKETLYRNEIIKSRIKAEVKKLIETI